MIDYVREVGNDKEYHIDNMNGVADHLHALVTFKSTHRISRFANDMKGESSHWINQQNLFKLATLSDGKKDILPSQLVPEK